MIECIDKLTIFFLTFQGVVIILLSAAVAHLQIKIKEMQ